MYPKIKIEEWKEVNKMNNFNVDDLLNELEAWNADHDKDLNPTKSERELIELREAVAKLKEERKAKANKNKEAMKEARDRSNNVSIDKYVAMVESKKREFKEHYF